MGVARKKHTSMEIRILLAVVIYLASPCQADSLSVKGAEESVVERIEFKPRTTVDLTNAKKEMLYGSVIWFKPKQEQEQEQDDGEGDTVDQERDIIRLKSRETVTYRRQNKSVKEENKSENKAEEDEVAVRKSKEIGANNEKASKAIKNAQSETQNLSNSPSVSELREILGLRGLKENSPNIHKPDESQSQKQVKRRKNNGENRRRNRNRNKNRKQNTTVKTVNSDSVEDKVSPSQENKKTQAQTSVSGNKRKKNKNPGDSVSISNEGPQSVGSKKVNGEGETELKPEVKAEVIKQIKTKVEEQIENAKKETEDNPASSDKKDENKSDSEKANIVKNADLLGQLLAQSDPGLVKILIDNSSPENLNVFLNNSNITVEELKDIVAY